jgi:hypothetical protein
MPTDESLAAPAADGGAIQPTRRTIALVRGER